MRRKNFLKRGLSTVLPHNFSDRILKQYRQILNGNEDLAKALTAADNATLHSVSGVVISNERDIRTGKLLPFRGTRKEKRKFRKVWRKGFKSFLDVETTTLYFNVIDRLRFSNSKANCVALTKRHKKKCLNVLADRVTLSGCFLLLRTRVLSQKSWKTMLLLTAKNSIQGVEEL